MASDEGACPIGRSGQTQLAGDGGDCASRSPHGSCSPCCLRSLVDAGSVVAWSAERRPARTPLATWYGDAAAPFPADIFSSRRYAGIHEANDGEAFR